MFSSKYGWISSTDFTLFCILLHSSCYWAQASQNTLFLSSIFLRIYLSRVLIVVISLLIQSIWLMPQPVSNWHRRNWVFLNPWDKLPSTSPTLIPQPACIFLAPLFTQLMRETVTASILWFLLSVTCYRFSKCLPNLQLTLSSDRWRSLWFNSVPIFFQAPLLPTFMTAICLGFISTPVIAQNSVTLASIVYLRWR